MKNKPELSQLLYERQELFVKHRSLVTPEMETKKRILADTMRQMSSKTCRTYSLFDLNEGKITEHFSSYSQQIKCPAIFCTESKDWVYNYRLCPAEDLYSICETEIMYYRLLMSMSYDRREELNMITLRRMMSPEGNYNLFVVRAFVIASDALGMPWLMMIDTEQLFRLETSQFYPNCQFLLLNKLDDSILERLESNNTTKLSKIQLEILLATKEDRSIKNMAAEFGIAKSTVINHRTEINRKLNTTSLQCSIQVAKMLRIL